MRHRSFISRTERQVTIQKQPLRLLQSAAGVCASGARLPHRRLPASGANKAGCCMSVGCNKVRRNATGPRNRAPRRPCSLAVGGSPPIYFRPASSCDTPAVIASADGCPSLVCKTDPAGALRHPWQRTLAVAGIDRSAAGRAPMRQRCARPAGGVAQSQSSALGPM
eukprot:6534969-Prymnesium_polylepis.1